MTELMLYLYAESPVHAGGSESLGTLDLPIQREATTRYPVIWGQSLKGALRQAAAQAGAANGWNRDTVTAVFGSDVANGEGGATSPGRLAVGDAQLVAMPVPTLQRTFAWVTSTLALARLARKYGRLASLEDPIPRVPAVGPARGGAASACWTRAGTTPGSTRGAARPHGPADEVLGPCLVDLGDDPDPAVSAWAVRLSQDLLGGEVPFGQLAPKLAEDLVLVGEDIMPTLLTECTEFVARVQLNENKTVANGPFQCEYLPAETILAASLTLRDGDQTVNQLALLRTLLGGSLHQVGGDESIGKGLVWTRLLGGEA